MQTPILLSDLAALCGAEIKGDPKTVITGIASIENAQPGTIGFLERSKYRKFMDDCKASALILGRKDAGNWTGNALVVDHPALAYAKIAACFDKTPLQSAGIHPTAVIGQNCQIHPTASIAAHVVIGDQVEIGPDVMIGPTCTLSDRVKIGAKTRLRANVTLYHDVQIGQRVHIDSGAVIGADGFGLTKAGADWIKIPQIGSVLIEDDVAIGASTTIDRGAIGNTLIKKGVKIDNLVMIAHNVQIGEHTAIAACTAIAGSAKIGAHCMIGGACSIADHVEIADQVMLTGTTTVPVSITTQGVYSSGTPATEHMKWKRTMYRLLKLEDLQHKVDRLERQLEQLTQEQQ